MFRIRVRVTLLRQYNVQPNFPIITGVNDMLLNVGGARVRNHCHCDHDHQVPDVCGYVGGGAATVSPVE